MTGESSSRVYIQAKAQRMKDCYPGFHTLNTAMVIDEIKKLHYQEIFMGLVQGNI